MIFASELVNDGITGTGVKLDWETPISLPPGTRTIASPALVNAGITGTGVHLDWQAQYHITCRFVPSFTALESVAPSASDIAVVAAVRLADGAVQLTAYATDLEQVKRYARTFAESVAATVGSTGVRVEVTDSDHRPLCEIAV